MSTMMLAQTFAEKAKVNAEFVLAALKGLPRDVLRGDGIVPNLSFYPANQLIAEGIELAMKALILARAQSSPPDHIAHHRLRSLYALIDKTKADKSFVDETVRSAVHRSSTGPMPFGLPNVASVAYRGGASLGGADPAAGYAEMDAAAFFALLDATWAAPEQQIPRRRQEIRRRRGAAHQYQSVGGRDPGVLGTRRTTRQQRTGRSDVGRAPVR